MRIIIILIILSITGCIVKGPKFTHVEKVLDLKPGLTLTEVNNTLGLKPYDLISMDSTGARVLLYKYRLTDRRTVPLFLKDTNGKEISAKFADLYCSFNSENILTNLYSQPSESELKEHRFNINNFMTFLTVTAPAFLLYLGITAP